MDKAIVNDPADSNEPEIEVIEFKSQYYEEKEFEKKIAEAVQNDDESIVDDEGSKINLPELSEAELDELKDKIMNLDPEQRKVVLSNLATNLVNPEKKRFSSATKKEIMREKIKRKRMEFEMERQKRIKEFQMNQHMLKEKYASPDDDDDIDDNSSNNSGEHEL